MGQHGLCHLSSNNQHQQALCRPAGQPGRQQARGTAAAAGLPKHLLLGRRFSVRFPVASAATAWASVCRVPVGMPWACPQPLVY